MQPTGHAIESQGFSGHWADICGDMDQKITQVAVKRFAGIVL